MRKIIKKTNDKSAFTLAEILGVISIIGVLLILVAPLITSKLSDKKEEAKDAGYKIIYEALSSYIFERPNYLRGKKYCIPIRNLIDSGKLSEPVQNVVTGEDISDYYILVYLFSYGGYYFEEPVLDVNCAGGADIPMIDFVVNPSKNIWSKMKNVTIIYPSSENGVSEISEKKYKKDDLSPVAASSSQDVVFDSNGKLVATAKYRNIKTNAVVPIKSEIEIGKIDGEVPKIVFQNSCNGGLIKISDQGGSHLKEYVVTNSSSAPSTGWTAVGDNKDEEIISSSILGESYYIYVRDNALNESHKQYNNRTKFKVTFDATGGTITKTEIDVINGQKYGTLPTISKVKIGYTFNGWYTEEIGGEKINSSTVVCLSDDQKLYAHWEPITYKISYNKNSGTGTMTTQTCVYDEDCKLSANSYTRDSYYFNSWNTRSNGSGTKYNDKQIVKNLTSTDGTTVTLYAQWNKLCDEIIYKQTETCSKKCGGGRYKREAYSSYDETTRCSSKDDYGGSECNKQDCCSSVHYVEGCTKECGTGYIKKYARSDYDNSRCSSKDNLTSTKCNTRSCCSSVYYVDGSTCSKSCGGGTYNRLAYSNYDDSRCFSKDQTSGGSACNTKACSSSGGSSSSTTLTRLRSSVEICPSDGASTCYSNNERLVVSNISVSGTNLSFKVSIKANTMYPPTGGDTFNSQVSKLCLSKGGSGTSCNKLIDGNIPVSYFSIKGNVNNRSESVSLSGLSSGEYRLILCNDNYPYIRFTKADSINGSYTIVKVN